MNRLFLILAVVTTVQIGIPRSAFAQIGPIYFYANLSADEESAPTESNGSGRAEFTLDRDTMRLSWVVTYVGLGQVLSAQIAGPQRVGVNGSQIYDLGKTGLKSPVKGSIVMTDGELQYLMERHLYVNITTARYKDGELRGQIERLPPKPSN